MAKALFGHVGIGNDLRLVAEVRRLRGRVAELEAEIARLQTHETVTDDDLRDRILIDLATGRVYPGPRRPRIP